MPSCNVHLKPKCCQRNYSTVLVPCGLHSISFEKSKYTVKIQTSTIQNSKLRRTKVNDLAIKTLKRILFFIAHKYQMTIHLCSLCLFSFFTSEYKKQQIHFLNKLIYRGKFPFWPAHEWTDAVLCWLMPVYNNTSL